MNLDNAAQNREELYGIRDRFKRGEITYDMAKELAQPVLERINTQGAIIAKKHGVKYSNVSFAAIMR